MEKAPFRKAESPQKETYAEDEKDENIVYTIFKYIALFLISCCLRMLLEKFFEEFAAMFWEPEKWALYFKDQECIDNMGSILCKSLSFS